MNLFKTKHIELFKEKALHWASSFSTCCYLDSNGYADPYGSSYNCIIAIDSIDELTVTHEDAFEALRTFQEKVKGTIFGYLTYDIKNQLEELESNNPDHCHFPLLFFFRPRIELLITDATVEIICNDSLIEASFIFESIENLVIPATNPLPKTVHIESRMDKQTYLSKVEKVKEHIHRGDIYELNLCQEFYAEDCSIDPVQTWEKLNMISPTPFSSFFKRKDQYILCASPERYLRKQAAVVISQPIKGTIKRSSDATEDANLKEQLYNDPKERSENVMIVDLVRNDLTRCASPGTVKVDELFGVYSFKQVHQLISTVSASLNPKFTYLEAIKDTFPMGSMTGAPKIKAMQLIERYEESLRGVYSGCIGYITSTQDFDFNVVIRSIVYNAAEQYLSFQVGGAITTNSDPEKEYEECLLKAQAIKQVLLNQR
ncbi:anthranilate synthase component I family protein [Solitalea canadensis]|uniref:anthranilate synthase component I family protein n=1 Tax=Solitalea canadensis TaxID=995 RepID=UPI0002E136FA|nr:anthranilate synthase component I family protein [Solitalea canadensis]